MDQNQNTGGAPVVSGTEGKSSMTLIYVLVAGVIIVLFGWYMMQGNTAVPASDTTVSPVVQQNTAPEAVDTSATADVAPDAATVALSAQGTSDDVAAIDADLKATDLGSLDTSGI